MPHRCAGRAGGVAGRVVCMWAGWSCVLAGCCAGCGVRPCIQVLPCCAHQPHSLHRTHPPSPPSLTFRPAVVDRVTGVVIPAIDPNFPDPLNSVNVTVINTPNARSEGARSGARAGALLGARAAVRRGVQQCGAGTGAVPAPAPLTPPCLVPPPLPCRDAGGPAAGLLCAAHRHQAGPAAAGARPGEEAVRGPGVGGCMAVGATLARAPAPPCRSASATSPLPPHTLSPLLPARLLTPPPPPPPAA